MRYPVGHQHTVTGCVGYLYSMLVKVYGASSDGQTRYSPAKCLGCIPQPVCGDPDPKHVSTSYIERQNLTMRT